MKYYRVFLKSRVIDYAYSIEQLKEVIAYNKVEYIELCEDNKILKTYNSLEEAINSIDKIGGEK